MDVHVEAGMAPTIPFGETTTTVHRVWAELLSVPLDRLMRMHGSPHVHIVRVHIRDTDGRTGIGFTYTLGTGATVVLAMVRDVIAPAIEGLPLPRIQATLDEVVRSTRRLGRAVFTPAVSATDIGAWDLCGHVRGLPLGRPLGGPRGRALQIYGSGRGSNELEDGELVEQSVLYANAGLGAIKLRVGVREPHRDVARVAAVRAALPDIRLFVDGNERLSPQTASALVEGLIDLGVEWLEEPFPAEDVAAHRRLADQTGIAIAVGEHLVGPAEMTAWVRSGAAKVMQPDAALCGGVTSAMAAARALPEVPIAFHSLPELHVHLAAAAPNAGLVEHFPLLDPVLEQPLAMSRGTVTPPESPGTGIRWAEEIIAGSRTHTTLT